jgi:murein DD-endopeptidase MepM/ murein hydrolase activator NlpD
VVPDLPCAKNGVPDDSGAPARRGRFAWLRPTSKGTTERKRSAAPARRTLTRTAVALAVLAVMGNSALVTTARADSLNDRHKALQQAIGATKQDMNESSRAASEAAVALTRAQQQLTDAQAALARTQQQVAAARVRDQQLAAKLRAQQAALAKATAAVQLGEHRLAVQKARVGQIVRSQFQQRSDLLPLAVLTTSTSMSDLENRIQLARTMLDTNQAKFNTYTALQKRLVATKALQARLERQVAADRAAAAKNLANKQALEQQAAQQQAAVADLVRKRASAQAAANKAAAADKAQYAELQSEDAAVQQRIAARIAQEKAAAAARAKAAAAARARARQHSQHSSGGGGGGGTSSSSSAHHGFIYPVDGPITSPYGMRFHPILHIWELHDGTDFGAACGTPIHAPYPGRVTERYYGVGYGNRLFIDHGQVDGHYITTAMNHAERYIVSPGQHVSQGQVVGYVGETGWATGCHLHLMVWEDGTKINPMHWY